MSRGEGTASEMPFFPATKVLQYNDYTYLKDV